LNADKFITVLQRFFGASKSEIIFAAVIVFGLIIGLVIKVLNTDIRNEENHRIDSVFDARIDSLAMVNRTTYIGTDIRNRPFEELASGDTIVEPEDYAPKTLPVKVIDLNEASRIQLMKLPGVGEKTALSIIEQREKQRFTKPEDIMKVKGIGPKKYEKMKEFIEVK
jgi:competence ComEA-like helix-hairpin-helix protein